MKGDYNKALPVRPRMAKRTSTTRLIRCFFFLFFFLFFFDAISSSLNNPLYTLASIKSQYALKRAAVVMALLKG